MTTEEFSNEFDSLLDSYSKQFDFGTTTTTTTIELDEYEKSVFLSNAQEAILISLYTGRLSGESFEKSEELRRYLSGLVKTYTVNTKLNSSSYIGLSKNSSFYKLPSDLLFITYESVTIDDKDMCFNGEDIPVVPVTQDEYYRIAKNPFQGASKRIVLRLDVGTDAVELISKYNIGRYLVRYLSKPTPIILTDLPTGLSIDNINKKTECKVSPILHRTILERAVNLAIQSKMPKKAGQSNV